MITLTVNGEPTDIDPQWSLHDLVLSIAPTTRGVAVAINSAVVAKSTWKTTTLSSGDQIEILTAAAGG